MTAKILITSFLSLWSIQIHAMPIFLPAGIESNPKALLLSAAGVIALFIILILMFYIVSFIKDCFKKPEPLDFSIQLEDYKDDDFKSLDSRKLHIIFYENTAWNKELPCMYESYKLNLIEQEIHARGEKTYLDK